MVELLSSEWEAATKARYNGVDPNSHNLEKTIFNRYNSLTSLIKDHLRNGSGKRNVLVAGVGRGIEGLCGPLPFEFASYLEELGLDYDMTIFDTNDHLLQSVRQKKGLAEKFLFQKKQWVVYPFIESDFQAWNDYLRATGQKPVVLSELGSHLAPQFSVSFSVELKADLPRSFREKLGNGGIRLQQGDAVTYDFSREEPYDFIHCLNLLCHLPNDSTSPITITDKDILLLTLHNLVRGLKKDGILLVDDLCNVNVNQFVPTGEAIQELKSRGIIELDKQIDNSTRTSYYFLRRT